MKALNQKILSTFEIFTRREAASGLILIVITILALGVANSGWGEAYHAFWQTPLQIGIGAAGLAKPLLLWVNDGLMAIFFFLVGLEIKRELLVGELREFKKAAVAIVAALGGMIGPALVYLAFNLGQDSLKGWAIPMATDIAFSLGVLALLNKRIPLSIKIFLTALAIIDDLGAVSVIALFYTETVAWNYLLWGAAILLVLIVLNRAGVQHIAFYVLPGVVLWFLVLKSGVHATIAGIALAMVIPAAPRFDTTAFSDRMKFLLDKFRAQNEDPQPHIIDDPDSQSLLADMRRAADSMETPLERLEHALILFVSFGIIPVFAFANTGVTLGAGGVDWTNPAFLGIVAGLSLGKPIGIVLSVYGARMLRLIEMPDGLGLREVLGVGLLAGIGFTMSLFISGLAFGNQPALNETARLGILVGSAIAGVAGFMLLRTRPVEEEGEEAV